MKKLFDWLNNTGLYVIALFLLAFIPLYPKLPLIDIVQTWAYIRLEDFFVAIACLILIIVKVRERKMMNTPLTVPIIMYFVVIGISLINALIFIFPKFPTFLYPHLALLHFIRRVEYISCFFLAFEAFRKKPNIWGVIGVLSGTYGLILLYGLGQKFLGFPAFLTMNEEFAKGLPLRLPSTARIPSTFGGHYDLGAFLVFTIPIMGSLVFAVRRWYTKIGYFLLALGGLVVLLFTASRISFGVYLVGISMMLLWQKKAILIIPVIILSIIILNLTSGASERFYKTFRVSDVVVDLSTGKPIGTLDKLEGMSATLQKIESPAEESLPKGSEFINLPSSSGTKASQQPEETIRKVDYLTSDGLTKGTGEMATISGSFLVQKALVYDISITTRLQGQWPRAMEAFRRNILLGSGLSSLSLAADGDYHRMLGETGILGAIAFLGILLTSFIVFFRAKDSVDTLTRSFSIGVFAGLTGLLCNAVLIDVFEASKVAFSLWLILGFTLSALTIKKEIHVPYFSLLKKIFTHPKARIVYLWLAVFIVWYQTLSVYFLGDDFTWTRWAAESSLGDIIRYFTQSQGFFYRPIPKLWYFGLFSIFWLRPFFYHVASLLLVSTITTLLYVFLKEKGMNWIVAWTMAFFFSVLSIHHENIFWISGQSSLLSACFLMLGMVLYQRMWMGRSRPTAIRTTVAMLSIFCSMLSYDGMIVAPIIVWLVSAWGYTKGKQTAWVLILIPIYWILRSYAGAVAPSGDYGYKWTTFFVNSIGNGAAYATGMFFGPRMLEYTAVVRSSLKAYLPQVTLGAVIVVFICLIVGYAIRRQLRMYKDAVVFLLAGCIASISYLGLGNASERYVFIPSLFVCIALAIVVSRIVEQSKTFVVKAIVIAGIFLLCWWNICDVHRLGDDWIKASNIAETALLAIKKEAFPPKEDVSFFFINTPIRYGRAWIFSTGMQDALWHMFRENLYGVYAMPSIQAGYEYRGYKGIRYVYIFDDYVIKRGIEKIYEVKNDQK